MQLSLRQPLMPVALATLLLAGCATVTTTPVAGPQQTAAEALQASGKYRESAMTWQSIADGTRGVARDRALLHAADNWERAGDLAAARQALAQSNRRHLTGDEALLHDLLAAEFLLADGRAADADALLGQAEAAVPDGQRTRWHSLRARAFAALGRDFEVAGEFVRLMPGAGTRERAATARNIEHLLGGLTGSDLAARAASLPADDPLYPFVARELARRGMPLPHPLQRSEAVRTDAFPPADSDGYRPPTQLAVLLPLSGTAASAGAAVRDGILAGYYAESRRRPVLKFYDSAGRADDTRRLAAQAIADGAQLILGPLTREAVDGLFAQDGVDVGVIALNRAQALPPGSASFALTPDEEGLVAADRCLQRGLRRIWVIGQSDDNSQRALAAFRDELRARGGEIAGETQVAAAADSFGSQLTAQLAASHVAPDAVFLALRAAPARLVAAQLQDSTLAALPRLATSLILAGGGNARLDAELDGIEYPELPWLLGRRSDLPDADALAAQLPSARGSAQRLFAFGLDAWKLAAYYDRLTRDPGFTLQGATGQLRLDSLGVVQREPGWAVFRAGQPQPAPEASAGR